MVLTVREAALRRALTFVGTTENPPGSNKGPLIDQWNESAGVPAGSFWCCSFIHAMFKQAANYSLGGGASVSALLYWARTAKFVVARPRRGDLACFDFSEGDRYGPFGDHIGQVVRVLALRWSGGKFTGWIRTVEGNTSRQNDLFGSQSNGGGVFIRTRWIRKPVGAVFVRVPGSKLN
jgi:hypothetical protein